MPRSPVSESDSESEVHSWGSYYESEVAAARAVQAVLRSESLQAFVVTRRPGAGAGIFFTRCLSSS